MPTLRQFECLVAVAEERHFSRAADRLGMAQSALSVQVRQLEQRLGVRLFNRNKRQPISLTEAGALLHAEAATALRHVARAQRLAASVAQGSSGTVRLGYVASAVTSGLLSNVLGAFRPGHEQVRMDVIAMETPRQLAALDAAEIDVGLVRPRRQYPDGVDAAMIHSEPVMLALAAQHPLAAHVSVAASELRHQSFIEPQFANEPEGFADILARLAEVGGFPLSPACRVNDFITATSMVAAGYGIAIVPQSIRLFRQPGVEFRPIRDFSTEVQLALAWRRRELSPAVRAFVAAARARLAGGDRPGGGDQPGRR